MGDYLKIAREAGERWARSKDGGEEIAEGTGETLPISEDTSGWLSDDAFTAQPHESHEEDASVGDGAEVGHGDPSPFEDAALTHTVIALSSLLKEEPEYASERDPEVLINAVAGRPDMFFVPTPAEMIEAMKTEGVKSSTISDAEVTMRRLSRAPLDENGHHNLVQQWVGTRGKILVSYPDAEYLPTIRIARDLQRKAYFADGTSDEEVAEILDKLVKEQKRANLRKKSHQKARAAETSATNDSSAESHPEGDSQLKQR